MNYQPDPEFDAIVSGLKYEMRDPAVTEIFEGVREAEEALNRNGGKVDARQKSEVLHILNQLLQANDLSRAEIFVSGRVRITDDIDDEFDDEIMPDEISALGVKMHDEDGPYYTVSQHALYCGDFEIVSIAEPMYEGDDRVTHRVFLNFNSSYDADPSQGWLYVYPRDLDVLEPRQPSIAKMKQELRDNYPDIAAQLDQLPDDCQDDDMIYRALEDFVLVIDWSKHPSLTETERTELLEYAVQYIGDRLQFDTDSYEVAVQGPLYSVSKDGGVVSRNSSESIVIRGYIGNVRLTSTMADGEKATYLPDLELAVSAGRRGGGNHLIYVPLTSIHAIKNLRNEILFGEDAAREFEREGEYEVEPVSSQDDVEQQVDGFSVDTINGERMEETREQELIDYEERLHNLFTACAEVTSQVYQTKDEAFEAAHELSEYIRVFNRMLPAYPAMLELYGPGVGYMHVARTHDVNEKGEVVITYGDVRQEEAGLFAKRGLYQRIILSVPTPDEDEVFTVVARMILQDAEPDSPISIGGDMDVEVLPYVVQNQRAFWADPDTSMTTVSLPELDRMRYMKELISGIAETFPDLERIPQQLYEFQGHIDASDPQRFSMLPDINLINSIGLTVGGDEEASKRVVTALSEIIADHQVVVAGPMYTEDGTHVEFQELQGVVVDVNDSVDTIASGEPMLKLLSAEQGVRYVPLSTIESMRI